jgi:hypothetical protein
MSTDENQLIFSVQNTLANVTKTHAGKSDAELLKWVTALLLQTNEDESSSEIEPVILGMTCLNALSMILATREVKDRNLREIDRLWGLVNNPTPEMKKKASSLDKNSLQAVYTDKNLNYYIFYALHKINVLLGIDLDDSDDSDDDSDDE